MKALIAAAIGIALLAIPTALPAAAEGTLDRLRKEGEIRLGYRVDTPPFSYRNRVGETVGYSIRLCRAVTAFLENTVLGESLSIEFVEVAASDRFEKVQDGTIDLLCGATTATLSRREFVDFSIPTFVDGAGVVLRKDGPRSADQLSDQTIGVRKGTTTEFALQDIIRRLGITVETKPVPDHREGIARLRVGDIAGYFADRSILLYYLLDLPDAHADQLYLSDQQFTYEPYALALRRGDSDFRLAVDRALSHIFRSGAIGDIFRGSFGASARPTGDLLALYRISILPE